MWQKVTALSETVRIHPHKKTKKNYTRWLLYIFLGLVVILAFTAGYLAVKLEKSEQRVEELRLNSERARY